MWQQLDAHPQYEIYSEYDESIHCYPIRKIGTNPKILKTFIDKGYVHIHLENHVKCRVNRVIAEQFIVNDDPDNKTEVDHINRVRTDNRIDNLRWVTSLQNQNNRGKTRTGRDVNFIQELPDDAIVVNRYGNYRFNGYFFADDVFYRDTGNGDFRIVPWHYNQSKNNYTVMLTDENTITRTITKSVFYELYGLDE